MNRYKLEEMLYNYQNIKFDLLVCKKRIKNNHDLMNNEREIKGINYSDMPKGNEISNTTMDKAVNIIDNIEGQENKLQEELLKLNKKYVYINRLLEVLDEVELELIETRYMKHKKWDSINMGICRRQCFKLKDIAIKKMIGKIELDKLSEIAGIEISLNDEIHILKTVGNMDYDTRLLVDWNKRIKIVKAGTFEKGFKNILLL